MNKIRVMSIVGSRPEGIKMAPVVKRLAGAAQVESIVCATSQHREMLDQVLDLFNIKPDYDLNLMRPNQTLSALSAGILQSLDSVFHNAEPDWVLVQGDTTTVAIASMSAYYNRICVGHVEAGLRSHNKWRPFPEEINRRIAGTIADVHFAPTEIAKNNLLTEGIDEQSIVVTGNTVIDALYMTTDMPISRRAKQILNKCRLSLKSNPKLRIILVTAHRRENFGKPIENICNALKTIAHEYGENVQIVYPVHLNPNVKNPVSKHLSGVDNIHLESPLDYLDLVHILKNCDLVITDSGGIQEEAPGLGKPVLVLRDVTERPEGVTAGTVKLVGTEVQDIVAQTKLLLDNKNEYEKMAGARNPYGDGHAAERIVNSIIQSDLR